MLARLCSKKKEREKGGTDIAQRGQNYNAWQDMPLRCAERSKHMTFYLTGSEDASPLSPSAVNITVARLDQTYMPLTVFLTPPPSKKTLLKNTAISKT